MTVTPPVAKKVPAPRVHHGDTFVDQYEWLRAKDDPEVIALGVAPLQVLGMIQPLSAATMVYSGALRGAGDTRWTLLITALSVWVLRIPLTLALLGPLGLGGRELLDLGDELALLPLA